MSAPESQMDASSTAAFWDQRHRALEPFRSGGHIARTERENVAFYDARLGMIHQLLGEFGGGPGRNTLLDAGCGKGWFSHALARSGFRVLGLDSSPRAIDEARTSDADERTVFAQGDLTDAPIFGAFDVVIVVDVLFHVLDDSHWTRSVESLASACAPGGTLLVTDTFMDTTADLGGYIRLRPPAMYGTVLDAAGFRRTGSLRYGGAQTDLGFFRYGRM